MVFMGSNKDLYLHQLFQSESAGNGGYGGSQQLMKSM